MYIVGKELGDKVIESFGEYEILEDAEVALKIISEFLGEEISIFEEKE